MSDWKKGDMVQVKSVNGPRMTVVLTGGTHPDGSVECVWHDAAGQLRRGAFNEDALERATPDP